eukprot:gene25513-34066_t
MKRPLDTDEDNESESESESEMELDNATDSGAGGGSVVSVNESSGSGRSSKTKERNRMHSKLTRLRRVSRINQMKQRLLDLQTETTRLEQLFDELNTANILLCLRVNMPSNTIDEMNSLGEAAASDLHGGKGLDTRENILDQLKERVRAEAEILREKFHNSQSNKAYGIPQSSMDSAHGFIYVDHEAFNDKESEKRERNRIHAKLTRVRRKLLTNEVQDAIQLLEAKNSMMHNKLDALIRSNLDNLNILVVDDVSSIRKTTKKMLEKSGFNVVISENGAEAAIRNKERQQYQLQEQQLASVSTLPPSSTVASESAATGTPDDTTTVPDAASATPAEGAKNDVGEESGSKNDFNSAAFNAALMGPKKQTFIIALSAFSDEVTLAETYQAGADAFIAKPFNLSQFKETLQSLMTMTN